MGVLAALFSRAAPLLKGAGRYAKRGYKYMTQGINSPVGKTTGAKPIKVQGPIKDIASKKGNKLSMETFGTGGAKGNTLISSADAARLTGKAAKIQAVRNTGIAATAVGGGLGFASTREKPSTARDIKEKKAKNAPLIQKDAPPMENQAEVKQQAPKKAQGKPKKGGRTPFQDAFKAAYDGGRGLGSTFSFGKPGQKKQYLAVTKEDLRRGGYSTLGEWQRGQRKAGPSVAKGTSSENFKGHGGGYGLNIAGPVAKTTSSNDSRTTKLDGGYRIPFTELQKAQSRAILMEMKEAKAIDDELAIKSMRQKDRRKSGARKGTFGVY